VVTISECRIRSTSKSVSLTPLTVSDVPSSATDPFGAMKRASGIGRAQGEAPGFAFIGNRNQICHAINMAADHVAAELVADLQRSLEIDPRALCPGADGGQPERFFPGFDLEPAGIVSIGQAVP
jgi:hypothetical protein